MNIQKHVVEAVAPVIFIIAIYGYFAYSSHNETELKKARIEACSRVQSAAISASAPVPNCEK